MVNCVISCSLYKWLVSSEVKLKCPCTFMFSVFFSFFFFNYLRTKIRQSIKGIHLTAKTTKLAVRVRPERWSLLLRIQPSIWCCS